MGAFLVVVPEVGLVPRIRAASPGRSKRNTIAFCPLKGRALQVPLPLIEIQNERPLDARFAFGAGSGT